MAQQALDGHIARIHSAILCVAITGYFRYRKEKTMSEGNQYTKYEYQKLFDLDVEMMRRYGYSEEEAKIIADVLLTSDLFGIESHGCNRMTLYPFSLDIGRIKRGVTMEVVEDSLCFAVIDAKDGMGQLAGVKAMNLAIEKAKQYGVGMVSVRNSNHYGIAGYYSKLAADAGMMGISMTNAEALVVPTYGREPMLGTNPIAITIPAKPHNFHLDFATSIMTCGKMEVYAKIDHELKPGMLVDEQGVTSTDPHKFIEIRANKTNPDYTEKTRGGIMPWGGEGMDFGGHKGFGFGMLVDIMCGIMSHGAVSKGIRVTKKDEKCCHFFAAIDFGRWTRRRPSACCLNTCRACGMRRRPRAMTGSTCTGTRSQTVRRRCSPTASESTRRRRRISANTVRNLASMRTST